VICTHPSVPCTQEENPAPVAVNTLKAVLLEMITSSRFFELYGVLLTYDMTSMHSDYNYF
jgi:hypothetical protein